jgi:hypothetical protein
MKLQQIAAVTAAATIASAGTAVAGTAYINGRDIKNHTITTKKLTKGAVASLHGQAGTPGAQGVPGVPGPQGVQGPAGSFSSIQRVTQTQSVPPGQAMTITAQCPAGYQVISGGFYSVTEVVASDSFGTATAWKAIYYNGDSSAWDASAIAYCVR